MQILILIFLVHFNSTAQETEPVVVQGYRQRHDVRRFRPKVQPEDKELTSVLHTLPNISSASGANKPRFFQIRGIGDTSQFEHSQVNSFGIFYEGIDLSEEASAVPLLGRESMLVTFGPQSYSWGGKALAGSLELSSCLEKTCSRQKWQGIAGNYNTYGISGGSTFRSAVINAGYLSSDGYIHNQYLNKPTAEQREGDAVAGFGYSLGSFKFRQHHLYANHRNGYDNWAFSPSYKTLSDHPGHDRHQVHGHSLQWQQGGEEISVWGLTSYTSTQQQEAYDEDWSNDPANDYFAAFERKRSKFHQKLAVKRHGFEAGLHFYTYQEDQVIRSFKNENLRKVTEPDFQSQNLALWIGQEWSWDDYLLIAGARGETQKVRLSGIGDNRSREVAPQFSADIKLRRSWSDAFLSELLLQRGFRGGGYNSSPDVTDDRMAFEPEQLYLVQLSNQIGDQDYSLMARVFHHWHEHQQARSSFQSDPMDPNTFTYFTTNVGGSRAAGAELSFLRKWKAWSATGGAGWLRSHYYSGREVAQSPSWTQHLRLQYAPEKWSSYLQVSGRDGYYHSADHDFKSKPYSLFDAGTSYQLGKWNFGLWIKNIFDHKYVVRAYYFANEPPAWETKYYTQLGPPRTFGTQAVYEF